MPRNTLDAVFRLIRPAWTIPISLTRVAGVSLMSFGSSSSSFRRRIMSPSIQLAASLAGTPRAVTSSKKSTRAFCPVMMPASYSGRPSWV